MAKKKIHRITILAILLRYKKGEALQSIGKHFKLSYARVRKTLCDNGVDIVKGRRRLPPLDAADIIPKYERGDTIVSIAKGLRTSRARVREVLCAGGVPISSRAKPLEGPPLEDAKRRYIAGELLIDIAQAYDMGSNAMSRKLAGAGVERRVDVTRKRDAEIVEVYLSGVEVAELSSRFGVGTASIRRALKIGGVKLRGRRGPSHRVNDNEVLQLYLAGESGPAISKKLGISSTHVYQIIRVSGNTVRSSTRPAVWREQRYRVVLYDIGEGVSTLAEDLPRGEADDIAATARGEGLSRGSYIVVEHN